MVIKEALELKMLKESGPAGVPGHHPVTAIKPINIACWKVSTLIDIEISS